MNYIDTHFHLDLWTNPPEIFSEIEKQKVYTIAVTNTPSVFYYTEELANNSKYVRSAIGLHPELAVERQGEIDLFKKILKRTRYVGEVGLDYVNITEDEKQIQKKVFETIVAECWEQKNKIITIHSRRSASDIIDIIGDNFPGTIILHWFSGSFKEMEKALSYGFHFSINNAMTLSKKGKQIIERLPNDKMLTETDGPFIKNKQVPHSPLMIPSIVQNLSKIKDMPVENLRVLIYSNFKQILMIDKGVIG
ncbi:Qat anti-phage system TatD family nuclease QatD [uncultured Microscilla sp.]|uniref:Qat anti-phage system TatD family nuclease QatD n=1 Tax=uncultured Microscilla sp. TaxID=432653 RepID=UPI0026171092|nr:Qat anti-phage system TatD family nuclease QatD [uncultured Microscilla sp.]